MYGDNKLPKADKFLKKRKNLKLWHRLLLFAGSIVVFITTYMLILPAITAEIGTLNIYDECLSSGGAVVEEVTDAESTSEATTEERTSSSSSGGGALSDGTILVVTIDEIDDDNEKEGEGLFANLLASTPQTDGVTITTKGGGDDGSYLCVYNSDTGEFELDLIINFTIPQNVLNSDFDTEIITDANCKKAYTIALPKDIIVPDTLLHSKYGGEATGSFNGQASGTNDTAFRYYFEPVYDNEGNITNYQVVMAFLDSYLNELNGGDISGYVKLKVHIGTESYTEDGKIIIGDKDSSFELEIDPGDIKFDGNETINRDVMVTKKGSYNPSDETVTYEVMVLSRKGTGTDPLYIKDTFSETGVLEALNAELLSIVYKQGVVGVAKYDYGTDISENRTVYNGPHDIEYRDDSTAQDIHYFYSGDDDDEVLDDDLIIVLPGLGEATGKYIPYEYMTEEQSNYYNYNAYVITYTYKIDPSVGEEYYFTNTAATTVHDDIANTDIEDSSFSTVKVTGAILITKSGEFNEADRSITWEITVGDGEKTLAGYMLIDDMFSGMKEELIDGLTEDELKAAIFKADGITPVSESDYTIVKDNDVVKGIRFTDSADKQYKIIYKTPVNESWSGKSITNVADLIPPSEDESTLSGKAQVWVPGGSDCFDKKLNSAVLNEVDGTYTLDWTTAFDVPLSGIPAGITFTDYVEGDGHCITYAQAQAIAAVLKEAWGEANIQNIQFYTGTNRWSIDENLWVSAENLTDTKYYQFRFTTVNKIVNKQPEGGTEEEGVVYKDNITYSYKTTADISTVTDSREYKNSFTGTDAEMTKSASWTYSKNVVKYGCDVNGNPTSTDTSDVKTNDGTVIWVVKVVLDDEFNTYKITDTLPAGVTLKELYMSKSSNYGYEAVSTDEGGTTSLFSDGNILNVVYNTEDLGENQVITLNTELMENTQWVNSLYIKYVCQIDEDGSNGTEDGSGAEADKIYNLTNSVNVTVDGEKEYGDDDQTTNVTWSEETSSEDDLTKSAQFDQDNNIIKYSLDINPNGEMYTTSDKEEFSDIQLKDILSYYSFPSDILRDASLINNSVELYYAETNADGSGKVGLDGKLINSGIKLGADEYTWSYDEELVHHDYNNGHPQDDITKYIYLTIPNGVPIIFKYEYQIKVIKAENTTWTDIGANVTNKAIIYIHGEEISVTPGEEIKNEVKESDTSGEANSGSSYTIYKVDKDNFALTLPGATFDFYVYDESTAGFKKLDSYTTSSSGYTGVNGKPVPKDESDSTVVAYDVKSADGNATYRIPVNTMCYFVESSAPEGYKLDDTTKYYFYFGQTSVVNPVDCSGYNDSMSSAINIIISHTEYVKNEHSYDYFAEKTNLTVLKRWLNANGEDITDGKADGSIKFKLMRVFTPREGSGGSGGDSGGGGTGDDSDKVNLNWTTQSSSGAAFSDGGSGTVKCEKNSKVTVTICDTSASVWWCPDVEITDTDTNEILVQSTGTTKWNIENQTFTAEIDVGETNKNIKIYVNDNSGNLTAKVVSNDMGSSEESTEAATEATTEDSADTVLHEHNFSDDKIREDITLNVDNKDPETGKSIGYEYNDGFFYISGNISTTHGTAIYEVEGEPTTLDTCLKMQSCTSIKFTAEKSGVLTLVFNENGNGNESTTIVNNCLIDGQIFSAYDNYVKREVTAGEHIITRQNTCYLFYMSFEEGASLKGTDIYKHTFDDGLGNHFYKTKEGSSTAANKGIVTYNGESFETCLKMNSKAEITFNAPFEGTLYMLITNPNDSPKVGVNIDGKDHYAVKTGLMDTNGNYVYLLPVRASKGTHTIKRINGTEVMLYYLEYLPDDDDFGNAELTPDAPDNPDAVVVDSYGKPDDTAIHTISAETGWTKIFTNLPWQVIDDVGRTTGYYSYYVVEVDTGYIIQYKNNIAEGISSGTIGIYNQDEDNSTELKVVKNWLGIDGQNENGLHIGDKVVFNLYRKINLNEGSTLDTSKTEAHSLVNYNSDFYTITTNHNAESGVINGPFSGIQYGTAKYNDKTYDSCLKMESQSSIKFTAPANGTLTLVFSKELPKTADGTPAAYGGLGFKLTHGSATNTYAYDASTDTTTGNCTVTYSDDGAIFNVTLEEAGDYEITTNKQCFLFYVDYTYRLSDANDGVMIGTYTIEESDIDSDGNSWTKVISGLFRDIKDDNNNKIGHYSYYVEEISPGSGYNTNIVYEQTDGDASAVYEDITAGTITITNQKNPNDIVLPETGGEGTGRYILAGLMLCFGAVLLLFKRYSRFRV